MNNKSVFILSSSSLIGLAFLFPIDEVSTLSTNFIWALLTVPTYLLFKTTIPYLSKRTMVLAELPSLLLSTVMKISRDLKIYGSLEYSAIAFFKNIFLITLSSFFFCFLFIFLFNNVYKISEKKSENPICRIIFLKLLLLFIVVWFPILLIFWPGIFSYDTPMQFYELATNQITNHHPIIHSLLMNIVIIIGNKTGNFNDGALIYTVFQFLICSSISAYVCSRTSNLRINRYAYCLVLLYYLLFPLNMLFPFVATKDVLFSSFFFLLVFKLIEKATTDNHLGKKDIAELVLIIILVGIFRNNAIYAIIATIPPLFIFRRTNKKNRIFLISFLIASVLTLGINTSLRAVTSAKSGMEGQMYSVPLQQLARSYVENPGSFNNDEKKRMFSYVPEKNLKNYNPRISDYVKSYFTFKNKGNSKKDFLKLWLSIGVKNKKNYVDAFLMLSQGYWDPGFHFPDKYYKLPIIELWSKETVLGDTFHEASKAPEIREKIIYSFDNSQVYKKIPYLSLLFSPGFVFWIILIFFFYALYVRAKKLYFIFFFLLMYYGTLILGPVTLVRYAYPYMLLWPIIGLTLFNYPVRSNMRDTTKV